MRQDAVGLVVRQTTADATYPEGGLALATKHAAARSGETVGDLERRHPRHDLAYQLHGVLIICEQ
jgi:hypothetical protein